MPEENHFSQAEEQAFRQLELPLQQAVLLKKYEELNQTAAAGGLVLAGDSLTEFLPQDRLDLGETVYNRGIRGIDSQFLLDHLETLVLDLAPSRLVLLIGTNDLMAGLSPEVLAERIEMMTERVQAALPACQIYLQSLYPRRQSDQWGSALTDDILVANLYLRQLSGLTYLDLHSHLADSRQELNPAFTRDGVHLTLAGYRCVLEQLNTLLAD